MLKTYKYKLDPNRKQKQALLRTLDTCRELYNMCLEQRRYQRGIGRFEQDLQLTVLKRAFSEYKQVYCEVLQNVVKQLDRSFQGFFRRCREGGVPGYPRFKGKNRYDSFSFNNKGFSLEGKRLKISKIGSIKIRLSRELPSGAVVKALQVKRSVNGWFCTLVFDYNPTPLPVSNLAIGIDVGLENFAALSDGTMIPNFRFGERGQAEFRRAQRRVERRKRGSNRRRQAAALLQKVANRIASRRQDFLHKQTTALVAKYGLIAVENLNVKGLVRGILGKQVHDASWSMFFNFLSYKAAEAGRKVIEVDCRYTSQTCPACGTRKKKALSEREHKCCECGYTTHRDTAAAEVVLARAEPLGGNLAEVIA